MKQFINDLDLDICAITENWLKEDDEIGKAALKPEGYEILSSPHPLRLGGGIAVIYQEDLKVTKSREHHFGTCKCTDYKISFDHSSYSWACFTDQMIICSWHLSMIWWSTWRTISQTSWNSSYWETLIFMLTNSMRKRQ